MLLWPSRAQLSESKLQGVHRHHPVPHKRGVQGQHPHRAWSVALTPHSCWLQVWRDSPQVIILWASAGGLWGPLSKGSPPSPAAGTGGTVLRLPLHNVGAGSQGWTPGSITHRCAWPELDPWLAISHKLQTLSESPGSAFRWRRCCKIAFLVAAFH